MFYANSWCGQLSPAANFQRLTADTHTENLAPIRGAVANSRGFREAFKCKVKEPVCKMF